MADHHFSLRVTGRCPRAQLGLLWVAMFGITAVYPFGPLELEDQLGLEAALETGVRMAGMLVVQLVNSRARWPDWLSQFFGDFWAH